MRRMAARGLLATALLLVSAVVGYRVLEPRDTLDPARSAYPAPAMATPALYGTLLHAPLVVDGRLRVYAAQREVWSDEPVDVKSSMSPYWSLRRWPAEVLGVVATGTTVVSQWSDGQLIALDASTGTIAWRVDAPSTSGGTYFGRRTGAATVYQPESLYLAGPTVLAAGTGRFAAFDAGTGRQLWTRPGECTGGSFSTPGVFACATRSTPRAYDASTGRPLDWSALGTDAEPFACTVGHSNCRGVRTPGRAWLIGADGGLTAAPSLVGADRWLVGDVIVVRQGDGRLTGRALSDNRPLWTWPDGGRSPDHAQLLATEPDAVHLLTAQRELVTVDPADGLELSRIELLGDGYNLFDAGHVYAADRFVFIERLRTGCASVLWGRCVLLPLAQRARARQLGLTQRRLGGGQERVVLLRRADRDAYPVALEHPHDHPLRLAGRAERGGPVAQRQPDEVAL